MAFPQAQKQFLASSEFAVIGASTNKEKYGSRVLKWYVDRKKPVTPIHPKEETLEGISTIRSVRDLKSPKTTSLSIITPPSLPRIFKITLGVLRDVKDLDIPAVWIQPGAEDDAVKSYIDEAGLADRVVLGGPCILVSGDDIVRSLL
ncbi:hypothetical protein BS47DRAFT_1393850 [Hydnum rufescens UP504]|uniref:CoA-binding domain-containing protein n=1 Tax=Hydnum rufescens UP504 TaxID=1448309 RepID=A0A9P6AW81_9AGAM|nr:hypothetical protein BS47DRAFT_1393850 [Hydnum rufescens UP504]